jgi:hypothetical protein
MKIAWGDPSGFLQMPGRKETHPGRKGEKPCPSAKAPHRKKEKPCPDRGNKDDIVISSLGRKGVLSGRGFLVRARFSKPKNRAGKPPSNSPWRPRMGSYFGVFLTHNPLQKSQNPQTTAYRNPKNPDPPRVGRGLGFWGFQSEMSGDFEIFGVGCACQKRQNMTSTGWDC